MSAVKLIVRPRYGSINQSLKALAQMCQSSSCMRNKPTYESIRKAHSDNAKSKILAQSSILVQDGIGFEELPILMRRATKDSFPFASYSFSGNSVKQESEFDVTFRQALQNCGSVTEVFKLLEVPHNQVEGYSAAFALQRLHELKTFNTDWHHIHSFIRSAVMRELYERVQTDVKLLSSETLLSLVECYLGAEGFSISCLDTINEEIQVRLADNAFTIAELLSLAEILKGTRTTRAFRPKPESVENTTKSSDFVTHTLSSFSPHSELYPEEINPPQKVQHFDKFSAKESSEVRGEISSKCQELLGNIWIHLVSRYPDVDEHTLPLVLEALTPDRRRVVPLLEKPLSFLWTELTPDGVTSILNSLCRLNVHNAGCMSHLGRWAYVHIHQLNSALLLSFLHTFSKFSYLDTNLIKVLEKYVQVKGVLTETDMLSMCVEYCTRCRFLSPIILDAAASHLTEHGDTYEPLQLYAIVRAFGYLNYLPLDVSAFLRKTESCLWKQFDNLHEHQILEVLGSLTFVNVLPKNFYQRVTSPYFYTKVGAMAYHHKASAVMWLRVLKHAVALNLSTNVNSNLDWILQQRNRRSVFLYKNHHRFAVLAIREALDALVGSKYNHVLPVYGCCAVYLDKNKMPLEVKAYPGQIKILGKINSKIVLTLHSSEHFTVNTKQLLGAQAHRKRNLEQLGFNIVEIRANHLQYADESLEVLRERLAPYIDLDTVLENRLEGFDSDVKAVPPSVGDDKDYLSHEINGIISDDDNSDID